MEIFLCFISIKSDAKNSNKLTRISIIFRAMHSTDLALNYLHRNRYKIMGTCLIVFPLSK